MTLLDWANLHPNDNVARLIAALKTQNDILDDVVLRNLTAPRLEFRKSLH